MRLKLRETKGEFILNGALELLLTCLLVVLGISTLGIAMQANKLSTMAGDLTRYIEVRGQVDSSVDGELSRLETAGGIDVTLSVDTSYTAGGDRIQFGDPFTVKLSYTGRLGMGGVLSLPIPLSASVVGRSERYWK